MRKLGGRLLKFLARWGLWSLIPIFVGISLWTTIVPALVNPVTLPEPTPQDKAAIEQAVKSPGGEQLTKVGYKATIKVSDEGIIKLLDQEEKKAGQANPGPYVLFSLGRPEIKQADINFGPDQIVDVANGSIVAMHQVFIDSNGDLDRGSVCYNSSSIDVLGGNWVVINTYLHGKSLNQQIPVNHELVPQVPAGFATQCYVFKS